MHTANWIHHEKKDGLKVMGTKIFPRNITAGWFWVFLRFFIKINYVNLKKKQGKNTKATCSYIPGEDCSLELIFWKSDSSSLKLQRFWLETQFFLSTIAFWHSIQIHRIKNIVPVKFAENNFLFLSSKKRIFYVNLV